MFLYNMFNRIFSRELTDYTVVFLSAPRNLQSFRRVMAKDASDAMSKVIFLPPHNITEITDCFPTIRN